MKSLSDRRVEGTPMRSENYVGVMKKRNFCYSIAGYTGIAAREHIVGTRRFQKITVSITDSYNKT
jgi:hypothetical protein